MCLDEARQLGNGTLEWYACLLKGMIQLHQGQYETARKLFTSGESWDVPESHSRPSLLTTEFLGDIHLEQGEAEPALKLYDEVWPKALALVPKGDIVAELRRRRAECLLLLGRHEEAHREALTGLEHCRELGDRYEEAATYRVLAMCAAAVGKPQDAKKWFDQGFAYYDDIETPFEWGKLWTSYGDWLSSPLAAEFADKRGALEAYHAAHDHFERMGSEAKLAEVRKKIVALTAALAPAQPATPAARAAAQESVSNTARPTRPQRRPRGSTELQRRVDWAFETFGLVTRSKLVLDILDTVAKLAAADSPILILGESGTGKELIAIAIHRLSGRAGQYMPVNSSAMPREIIESELFGYVPGAFTGAMREKAGIVEVCDGGTVFLDEIGELSLDLQSRLLRFLETGEARRVGATRNYTVDTRVVAATNRARSELQRGERFRPDLYYRLAHAVVTMPALRHRGDDLELLVEHFLEASHARSNKRVTLSEAAWRRLKAHPWPGNIRELGSTVQRLVTLAAHGHAIRAEEIELDDAAIPSSLTEELEAEERRRLLEALAAARGVKSDAARALHMSRTTFITKLKRYGMM